MTNVGSSKLLPKYIGLFRVLRRQGNAYTIKMPRKMRTHPTFYLGRLSPLPTIKIDLTLKNLHQILALALQTINLNLAPTLKNRHPILALTI